RRSVYIFVRRNLRYPLFDVFDRPDTNASCPQRPRSTTAPQSLTLLNSDFTLAAARDLAGCVLNQAGTEPRNQIELCYLKTVRRRPTNAELIAASEFLKHQAVQLKRDARAIDSLAIPSNLPEQVDPYSAAALTEYCLALFNLNEFIYLD